EESESVRLTFSSDGKVKILRGMLSAEGTYKLPAAGQLDLTIAGVTDPVLGILKFDGDDRLTLCTRDGVGAKRPTEFTGAQGTGQELDLRERAKPGDEKPRVDKDREAADRVESSNNLKEIVLAMHNHHIALNEFPGHAIYSKDGKRPLLSWRVGILPYLE